LKLLAEKKVNAQGLISHRFAIAEWDKALEVMKNKKGLKILLKPWG
jgi:threonine dehydrogenase-like Zn-dependent dehydrogenase